MILFSRSHDLSEWLDRQRSQGKRIGLVPTMGALHRGHVSLMDISKSSTDLTVCSIFVNPTQFNDPNDFRKYPIRIEKDIDLLVKAGVDALFLPGVDELYPGGTERLEKYDLGELETIWEGAYRPGHFQGVCQVVHRLLDIIRPHQLFMGQKDYQQCLVIQRLLDISGSTVLLHTCPIVRDTDGLAMSSRNLRLTAEEREKAPGIYQTLCWMKNHVRDTEADNLADLARERLTGMGFGVDYVAITGGSELERLKGNVDKGARRQSGKPEMPLALVAAYLGDVRLIDNMFLDSFQNS